ncbi:hypothetical protein EK21DRAFT_54656 [Setomelanomma holmii]|uniref:Secreted protein n=1 Tax=Setomelanomma holmii TaxID=210430 RepID=A0A9P4HLH6_9PLEO|nr:hypothetical protein EK21DRAFT_54656 [Setomelanomma holmii]
MQFITFVSAAAATIATVSAGPSAVELNANCNKTAPSAKVVNRCNYPVYIWSTFKNIGCETTGMVTLKKGEEYQENYQDPANGDTGVSIKISKTTECKGSDIVQLEYFLEKRADKQPYWGNYLDVSYVDCLGGDCPTKKEGYYLSAGSKADRAAKASADNSWCPVLACSDAASCAKMSYILPDDVQTKTCDLTASMNFYMCGSEAPSADDTPSVPASSAPASSSKKADPSTPKASSTVKVQSSADYKVNAAAVTPAAEIKDSAKTPKVKTKVVYVTAYEYVNAKRHEHAHAHARRHQPFHA